MDHSRLPYICLHGRVDGLRSKGRTRKRWLDCITDNCDEHEHIVVRDILLNHVSTQMVVYCTLKLSMRTTVALKKKTKKKIMTRRPAHWVF